MKPEAGERTREHLVLLAVVALAVVLVAAWRLVDPAVRHPEHAVPFWALLVSFVLVEAREIRIHIGSEGHDFTLAEIPTVVGLFLVSAPSLLLARVLSILVVRAARRQGPLKLAFNATLGAHDVVVAAVVLGWLGDEPGEFGPRSWFAALAGTGFASITSGGLVTFVIWIVASRRAQLRDMIGPAALISLCSASIGLLVVEFLIDEPARLALLGVPLLGLVAGYGAFERQVDERRRLAFLYRCTGAVARAESTDSAARAVLAECCDDLRAESAEIIVFSVDDGGFRYLGTRVGTEHRGQLTVAPEDAAELAAVVAATETTSIVTVDEAVRRRTPLETARSIWRRSGRLEVPDALRDHLARRGHRRVIVSPLTSGDRSFGLLVIGDRAAGAGEYGADDVPVVRTLTDQLSGSFASEALADAVDSLRVLQAELAHQAGHDQLTGLPNRRRFMERVEGALEAKRAGDGADVAILFIDLDDFKHANDTHGHAAGDALLVAVGERISASIRDGDVAARLGGDEFAVLLDGSDADRAIVVGHRIIESFLAPIEFEGASIRPAGSVGAATVEAGASVEEALRRADQAMYEAKQRGKGSFVHYDDLVMGR